MKIRLTETQYKRLLTEVIQPSDVDKDFGRLDSTIQEYMVKIFKVLWERMGDGKTEPEMLKFIIDYFGLSNHEAYIMLHNFKKKVLENDVDDIDSLLGEPLEFTGVYTIKTIMPTVVMARSYIPGFVLVRASSKKDAIDKALNHDYINMYLDYNSHEYQDPDLDYDLSGDADIMNDMVIDHVSDIDWSDDEEVEDRIKLML